MDDLCVSLTGLRKSHIHAFGKAADAHFAKQHPRCQSKPIAEINCQPCSATVALKTIGDASSLRGSDDSHALQEWRSRKLAIQGHCGYQTTAMLCSSGVGRSRDRKLTTFFCGNTAVSFHIPERVALQICPCRSLLGLVALQQTCPLITN